jgi:hypothetical protein
MVSENEFDGQFSITKGHAPQRSGSSRQRLSSLCVDIFPQLPIIKVLDRTGGMVGCLLGTPIDVDRHVILKDLHVIDGDLHVEATRDAVIESEIYRLAGSYVFVLDVPHARRLYLDANGTKSVVYNAADQIAAASSMLALASEEEYYARLDHGLHAALRVDGEGWIPAGLTAHRGVQRLICNHYLDLETFRCVRHWPASQVK